MNLRERLIFCAGCFLAGLMFAVLLVRVLS